MFRHDQPCEVKSKTPAPQCSTLANVCGVQLPAICRGAVMIKAKSLNYCSAAASLDRTMHARAGRRKDSAVRQSYGNVLVGTGAAYVRRCVRGELIHVGCTSVDLSPLR